MWLLNILILSHWPLAKILVRAPDFVMCIITIMYFGSGAWLIHPLVFSTSGSWSPSATIAFKRTASLNSTKLSQPYTTTKNFIRCKIAFSLMDSTVICQQGATSSLHQPARELNLAEQQLDLIVREAQLSA